MTDTVRAFIAISLPANLRAVVQEAQGAMRTAIGREKLVRWTPPEQLHLTMRFLGNVPAEKIGEIKAALCTVARGHQPFSLRLEGVGCFPSCANARIIWAGIAGEFEALSHLHRDIVTATAQFGEPPEKRAYKPHLTIGRVRAEALRDHRQVGEAVRTFHFPGSEPWEAREAHLVQSHLSPEGATYTTLASCPLAR